MRLFVALELPAAAAAGFAHWLECARRGAPEHGLRWMRADGAHLTLRFLGETDPAAVLALAADLAAVAARHAAIEAEIGSLPGAFPARGPVRVVWIGVSPAGPIAALAAEVAGACEARLGLAAESRPFTPHLTLARAGRSWRRADFEAWRARLELPAPITVRFEHLSLIESRPGSGGSRYAEVASAALGTGGP